MRFSFGTSRHQWTFAFERECLTTEEESHLTVADALVERSFPDDRSRHSEMDSRPIGFLPPPHGGYRPVDIGGRKPVLPPKGPGGGS